MSARLSGPHCTVCRSTDQQCIESDGGCCDACRATGGCSHTSEPVVSARLSDVEEGEAYYRARGWSGCAGSAWSRLAPATKDGWRHAEQLAARLAEVDQAAELVAKIEALVAKWDGCWCGEQMAPDHDPRVQDCPRHGDGAADHFGGLIRDDLRALLAQQHDGGGSDD